MLHLVDNDVVVKLARWDLLNTTVKYWGGHHCIRRIGSLLYSVCHPDKPKKALSRCGTQDAIERIKEFIRSVEPIPLPQDIGTLAVLNDIGGLDEGEALLLAFCTHEPNSWSFTGDKRAIEALASASTAHHIRRLLEGRIYCLEQLVAQLCFEEAHDTICGKIRNDKAADTAVSCAIGSSPNSLEAVLEGLRNYYENLQAKCGGLLAPFPVTFEKASSVER